MHDRLKTTGSHPTGNLSEPKHRTRSAGGRRAEASQARAQTTSDGALGGRGQMPPSPAPDTRAPSRSRSSLCGQDMCSAGRVAGRREEEEACRQEAWRPRSRGACKRQDERPSRKKYLLPAPLLESNLVF